MEHVNGRVMRRLYHVAYIIPRPAEAGGTARPITKNAAFTSVDFVS